MIRDDINPMIRFFSGKLDRPSALDDSVENSYFFFSFSFLTGDKLVLLNLIYIFGNLKNCRPDC